MNFKTIEYAPISIRNAGTVKCETLDAANVNIDDVSLDELSANKIDSIEYKQNGVPGAFVNKKNYGLLYVGDNAGQNADLAATGLFMGTNAGLSIVNQGGCIALGNNACKYTNGSQNIAIGDDCLEGALTGGDPFSSDNVCIGHNAGKHTEDHVLKNVCIGARAGEYLNDCENCTFVGSDCGPLATTPIQRCICVGHGARANKNDCIVFGDTLATTAGDIVLGSSVQKCVLPGADFNTDLGRIGSMWKDLYVGGNIKVLTINSHTPSGGMYSGTSPGTVIASVIPSVTASLLPSTSVGTLTIPANTMVHGNTYSILVAGTIAIGDNADSIEITVYWGGNLVALVEVDMENMVDSHFEIEADTVFQSTGVAAATATNIEFSYNKQALKDWKGTRKMDSGFVDTTIDRIFDIRARVIGLGGTTIQSKLVLLKQEY